MTTDLPAPRDDAELRQIADELRGSGALNAANIVEGSAKTPRHSVRELHAMGFTMGMFPVGARLLAAAGLNAYYDALARTGDPSGAAVGSAGVGFDAYNRVLGRDHMQGWNRLFGV